MKKKIKPNWRLLRRVQRTILKYPDQFHMGDWATSGHVDHCAPIGRCGTAACIGGWAVVLNKKSKPSRYRGYWLETNARKVLGLPKPGLFQPDLADTLFYVERWPEPFQKQYRKIMEHAYSNYDAHRKGWEKRAEKYALKLAQVAAKRIDHFIETYNEQ